MRRAQSVATASSEIGPAEAGSVHKYKEVNAMKYDDTVDFRVITNILRTIGLPPSMQDAPAGGSGGSPDLWRPVA